MIFEDEDLELEQDGEDVISFDELAVDEARDYCETCGRHVPDGGCAACGTPDLRSGDLA